MISSQDIFSIKSNQDFKVAALKVFKHQFEKNSVYRSFCDLLYKHPANINSVKDIPFLPISFFKSHQVVSSQEVVKKIFISSGTTGQITSKHYITELNLYEQSFTEGFKQFYGDIEQYTVLALLPSYLERDGSALVYMADHLIKLSKHPDSGFYLNDIDRLKNTLLELELKQQKTLLIGVSFALLDLIEFHQFQLKHTIVMETGGMKGRRKEPIRKELHDILKKGFGVDRIHSEYGMTELLSQGYSDGYGIFKCPNWMKILTRDPEDALSIQKPGKTGGINIIDLANINSCSFIASQDLGISHIDGSFEIIGRFDNSDIRGCNLMAL